MTPLVQRLLAVAALSALAGLAAFIVLSDDPETYERESSFAIRPSNAVPADGLADVVGTLSEPDSAVTETIVGILDSAKLRRSAAVAAGLPPDSVAESGAPYSWKASREPGSTIIDITLTGPDDAKLQLMQVAAKAKATDLVARNYELYRLESLTAPTESKQIGPEIAQTVALALLLGALLGIGLVFVERKVRQALAGPTAEPGGDGRARELTGETDQLESTLRESLGTGASVRRVGPGRIEVAHPKATPEREFVGRER